MRLSADSIAFNWASYLTTGFIFSFGNDQPISQIEIRLAREVPVLAAPGAGFEIGSQSRQAGFRVPDLGENGSGRSNARIQIGMRASPVRPE